MIDESTRPSVQTRRGTTEFPDFRSGHGATPVAVTRFLNVDGGRIAYDDTGGEGRLILAIPGLGDLRLQYRRLRPVLERAGYRVITMDVRGHGESSARWPDYSAHAVGRDALALLAHLDAGPAVILGSSFAAGSALWAAHDSPRSVAGVVLLGPIVRDPTVPWFARLALNIGLAGPWRVWFWTTYWDSLFPERPVDQAQVKAAITRNLREPGRMDALRTMIELSKADTAAIVSGSRVPALVVMGTKDADFPDPLAEARWLASELRARLSIIEGAGHYPQTESPEAVAPALLTFLESLGTTSASDG